MFILNLNFGTVKGKFPNLANKTEKDINLWSGLVHKYSDIVSQSNADKRKLYLYHQTKYLSVGNEKIPLNTTTFTLFFILCALFTNLRFKVKDLIVTPIKAFGELKQQVSFNRFSRLSKTRGLLDQTKQYTHFKKLKNCCYNTTNLHSTLKQYALVQKLLP